MDRRPDAVFAKVAAFDLGNFRPVSSDDVWIMSASYKLAEEGVFGADMYAGSFNADRPYFIALPAHHILQAVSFRMAGHRSGQVDFAGGGYRPHMVRELIDL